jgi:hypothetical protein
VERDQKAANRILRWSKLINDDMERPGRCEVVTWATTTNLAVRRSVFEEVGGFPSESLTQVGGEDCDLGIKMSDAGYKIVCDRDAVVTHDHDIVGSLATAGRRLYCYGRAEQWVCSVHPRHRRPVLNAFTLTTAAAALGVALAPRTRGRSLLAAPVSLGLLVGLRARRLRGDDRSVRGVAESTVCASVELMFDLGGFLAALELRRPSMLFTGMTSAEPTEIGSEQ